MPTTTHTAPPACSSLSVCSRARYVSQDGENHRIRRVEIATGATSTLAGSGVHNFKDDVVGTNAQFRWPHGVAIDPSGTFALVAVRAWPPCTPLVVPPSPHSGAHPPRTRAPDPPAVQGMVSAATHTAPPACSSLSVCSRARYVSQDHGNQRIRRVDIATGATTTLAGSGVQGFKDDVVGTNAQFDSPLCVAIAPTGAFALVGVRACPPLHPARRGLPPHRSAPASHTRPKPAGHRIPLRCGARHRHTPRHRLAPRSACLRARCITELWRKTNTENHHRYASVAAVPTTAVSFALAAIALAAAAVAVAAAAVAFVAAAVALVAAAVAVAAAAKRSTMSGPAVDAELRNIEDLWKMQRDPSVVRRDLWSMHSVVALAAAAEPFAAAAEPAAAAQPAA